MPLNRYSGAYDSAAPVGDVIPSATLPRGGDGKTLAEVRANALAPKPRRRTKPTRTAALSRKLRELERPPRAVVERIARDVVAKALGKRGRR